MTTITFNGGPFDGDVRAVDDAKWDTEFGCVVRSDAVGAIRATPGSGGVWVYELEQER